MERDAQLAPAPLAGPGGCLLFGAQQPWDSATAGKKARKQNQSSFDLKNRVHLIYPLFFKLLGSQVLRLSSSTMRARNVFLGEQQWIS